MSADLNNSEEAFKSVATMSISAVERIDEWAVKTKADIKQQLIDRDCLGQLDFYGHDMGRDVLEQAYRTIEAQASRQRAEVIDMAKSSLKALSGQSEPSNE